MRAYAIAGVAIRPDRPGVPGDVASTLAFTWAPSPEHARAILLEALERACPRSAGYTRYSVSAEAVPREYLSPPASA